MKSYTEEAIFNDCVKLFDVYMNMMGKLPSSLQCKLILHIVEEIWQYTEFENTEIERIFGEFRKKLMEEYSTKLD